MSGQFIFDFVDREEVKGNRKATWRLIKNRYKTGASMSFALLLNPPAASSYAVEIELKEIKK